MKQLKQRFALTLEAVLKSLHIPSLNPSPLRMEGLYATGNSPSLSIGEGARGWGKWLNVLKLQTMRLLFVLFLALIAGNSLFAQDDSGDTPTYPDTGVWVTTQDFSSLRIGPGTAFERITVLDPEVTLPAVGRTSSVSWVQVIYEGEPGWIFSPLLIWSGDVISLPVDGIITTRFIRRAIATGVTTR